jgi:hypothetical protein
MEEIEVRSVLVADEDGVFIVAFEASANEGLIFQLADRIERQDSMLGMDSYSVSTASGATMYGGVTDATADDSILVLTLTNEAADTLGLPDTVRLRLSGEGNWSSRHRPPADRHQRPQRLGPQRPPEPACGNVTRRRRLVTVVAYPNRQA